MAYFVTGGTGFIGRFLVENLLKRGEPVYVLVRKGSHRKTRGAAARMWGADDKQVIAVIGDLGKKNLGVADADLKKLKGKIEHMFHLAAIYDLNASAEDQQAANIDGTRHAVEFAEAVQAGCFHHVSSIAAAGLYDGVFREDMFEEAEDLDHPYFKTKHDSEGIVRRECKRPFRIYRPGFVVGHSKTGYIDKIDGPYYFFKLIQRLRNMLPPWMPTIGIEGGRINIVPVDFVADAMDYLAHKKGLDGKCFHLTDPEPHRIGEVLNIFAKAAHAPADDVAHQRADVRLHPGADPLRAGVIGADQADDSSGAQGSWHSEGRVRVRELADALRQSRSGQGAEGLRHRRAAARQLRGEAVGLLGTQPRPGPVHRPQLVGTRQGQGGRRDRRVIRHRQGDGAQARRRRRQGDAGRARRGKAGRNQEGDRAAGGKAWIYTADVSDMASCDALVARVLKEHGGCDYLVNNAGRSIRRGVINSFDRFHDFERTMQLNYFGALRLIMGFLPKMIENKRGQIINISSIGVLSNAPRFSAYVASKSALDSFAACAASEFVDKGINFTTINMPLVRTPMIAPTKMYENVPTLSPEQAADLVVEAIVYKPVRIATRLGIFGAICHAAAPRLTQIMLNTAFNMFPDSAAAQGQEGRRSRQTGTLGRADGVRAAHAGDSLVADRGAASCAPRPPRPRLRDRRQQRVVPDARQLDVLCASRCGTTSAA